MPRGQLLDSRDAVLYDIESRSYKLLKWTQISSSCSSNNSRSSSCRCFKCVRALQRWWLVDFLDSQLFCNWRWSSWKWRPTNKASSHRDGEVLTENENRLQGPYKGLGGTRGSGENLRAREGRRGEVRGLGEGRRSHVSWVGDGVPSPRARLRPKPGR